MSGGGIFNLAFQSCELRMISKRTKVNEIAGTVYKHVAKYESNQKRETVTDKMLEKYVADNNIKAVHWSKNRNNQYLDKPATK